ncbi:hypothetical protein EV188_101678 [Actinomycetospora succinea]|uniref:DUF2255 family protein n=1 Tax=Actinomycetospora succinea TaxID=663603 RepID=A0A4R6VS37_9PSEU|nr:DUF2255 family protein [Actinomycetospora succinea]TDQ65426.1 hypothetical protein EV188_101678 [Actinomycetospora succinea]
MTTTWSAEALQQVAEADELEIAVRRADGTLRRATPIWVVSAGNQVYVRTWYRRSTGWFGRVLESGRARVHVPGLDADVTVDDLGTADREIVDDAYRAKYGARYGAGSVERMVGDEAAATTLRLDPEP